MKKKRLLTPGPTPVPEETLLEMAKPVFYHRSSELRRILAEVEELLQYVFRTNNLVAPLTCSGTGGLEAALVNCVSPRQKVICLSAGRFGERWRKLCQALDIETVNVTAPYGEAVPPERLNQALKAHADAVAVCSTLSETSTGVAHDIEAFGRITRSHPALLLVDAISGLGVIECRTDQWGVDLCVAGSQKAFMMPPGLAFVSVSDKAWNVIEESPARNVYYWDLKKARQDLMTHDTPFTPAHTLLRALLLSLRRIHAEGIDNVIAYQACNAAAARAGVRAMGLEVFAKRPADGLTVAKMPPAIDSTEVVRKLDKRYGLRLADGQESLKGKIVRLGHMGYIDRFDVLAALSGLELVLLEMGHPVKPGTGVAAAQRVFANSIHSRKEKGEVCHEYL